MISVSLNSIAEPNNNVSDSNKSYPLSFVDWYNRNTGIAFNDADKQYKNYVDSFYGSVDKSSSLATNRLKSDYISLIKKLSILFKNDEDFSRYSTIDFDSVDDLKIAIPKYAEKLKNIALYYISKREELKRKKIEYNLVGSEAGLSTIIYNKLAGSFTGTKAPFGNENPLITMAPQFSAIRDNFSIEIQDLYNTIDPFYASENLNPFACIFNDTCSSLLDSPLSGLIDPMQSVFCENTTDKIEATLQAAYNKYIGTDIYYISGGNYKEYVRNTDLSFTVGNNYFYWFSGKNVFDIPDGKFRDVSINDIVWNSFGSTSYNNSDVLFLTVGNAANEGAWFQDTLYTTTTGVMSCVIADGRIFKFPFCNFGTSAFGGEWSGPSIVDTNNKPKEFYPSEEDFLNSQNDINTLYWNTFSSVSTVKGINIQDLSLGKTAGFASNDYINADKLIISSDGSDRKIYNDHVVGWLFDFKKTQLPIAPGKNNILFPIQSYNDSSELFFDYSVGTPVVLSSLDVGECFCGAVAGETLPFSDMIIKNATICGPEIEGAWLRSPALKNFKYNIGSECSCIDSLKTFSTGWEFISGGAQLGTSFRCNPGEYIRFTWTGESVDINDVKGFTGFSHDDACPYKSEDHSISIVDKNYLNDDNRSLFEKWKTCSCQAVQYSPFGHNYNDIEHFKITPDFIVKDTGFPNNFNKSIWKGSDGKPYLNSIDCAKFYPTIIEQYIGWGPGSWKNVSNQSSFILEKGSTYIYYRATTNNCSFESPYFVINHKYNKFNLKGISCDTISNLPVWMKAIKDSDGEWQDTGEISDMVLNFGDFITYDHKLEISEERTKLLYNGEDISSLSGASVVLDTRDEGISYISSTTQIPSINFLIQIPIEGNTPYWGEYNNARTTTTHEYLQIYQPKPLNKILNQFDIIEYKFGCNSACFLWEQPLVFDTYNPIKQWNKINVDPYVYSDILKYLNSEKNGCTVPGNNVTDCNTNFYSDCYRRCLTNKTGITATNEKSNLVFNTELSGIPVFITYIAKKDFVQPISVVDISNGLSSEYVPVVSGLLVSSEYPWRNIINNDRSVFVTEESTDLVSLDQLGFYIPSMISMNRFETHGDQYNMRELSGSLQTFSYDNYLKGSIGPKASNDFVANNTFGKTNGTIDIKYQNLTPYNSIFSEELLGLFQNNMNFSPWETYNWPTDSIKFKKDYKCVDDWFVSQLPLTGDVWNWDGDIFGNNYYLVMDETINFSTTPSNYGNIFIKRTDRTVSSMMESMSAVFSKYKNISFGTSANNFTYLTTEDSIMITTEDGNFIIL
jgi:hypothetical protein